MAAVVPLTRAVIDEGDFPSDEELGAQSSGQPVSLRRRAAVALAGVALLCTFVLQPTVPHLLGQKADSPLPLRPHWLVRFASAVAKENLEQGLSRSNVSERCSQELAGEWRNFTESYRSYKGACSNTSASASPACANATAKALAENQRKLQDRSGDCSHNGHMLCNITQVLAGKSYSRTHCLRDACDPEQLLMFSTFGEASSPSVCGKKTRCSLSVSCAGHDVATRDFPELPQKATGSLKGITMS